MHTMCFKFSYILFRNRFYILGNGMSLKGIFIITNFVICIGLCRILRRITVVHVIAIFIIFLLVGNFIGLTEGISWLINMLLCVLSV